MKTDVPLDLQRINIEKNAISQFPQTCKNKTSLLPQLTQLILRRNMIASLATEICLPALKHLDLGQNSISVLKKDSFSRDFSPGLTELYLDRMSNGIIANKTSGVQQSFAGISLCPTATLILILLIMLTQTAFKAVLAYQPCFSTITC